MVFKIMIKFYKNVKVFFKQDNYLEILIYVFNDLKILIFFYFFLIYVNVSKFVKKVELEINLKLLENIKMVFFRVCRKIKYLVEIG